MWCGVLDEAGPEILKALLQLGACPEVFRSFVIVRADGSPLREPGGGKFVQFCGSQERGVMFDVPELGIVASPCSPEEGVLLAVTTLANLGVPQNGKVRVLFESTGAGPKGLGSA